MEIIFRFHWDSSTVSLIQSELNSHSAGVLHCYSFGQTTFCLRHSSCFPLIVFDLVWSSALCVHWPPKCPFCCPNFWNRSLAKYSILINCFAIVCKRKLAVKRRRVTEPRCQLGASPFSECSNAVSFVYFRAAVEWRARQRQNTFYIWCWNCANRVNVYRQWMENSSEAQMTFTSRHEPVIAPGTNWAHGNSHEHRI